jgi:glycosyltransferase involved in cell wall biosynthesis
MEISGIVVLYNEEMYIQNSLNSIYPYIDELVIVDNYSDDDTVNKIKELSFINNENVKLIELKNKIPKHEAFNLALSSATKPWVLRWDGDFVAYNDNDLSINNDNIQDYKHRSITEIFKFLKDNNKWDGIILYAPNLYGDLYHLNKKNSYKIYQIWIIKKEFISYKENDKYFCICDINSKAKLFYLNKPDQDNFYLVHLSGVKPASHLLFQCFRNEYYCYCQKENRDLLTYTFQDYFEEVMKKQFNNSVNWTEKNIGNNITKIEYKFKLPKALENYADNPYFMIKYHKNIITREKINYTKAIHDYQITLITLVRNTEKYLNDCLQSVISQTNSNWKMIIINDGSDNGHIKLENYLLPSQNKYKHKFRIINLDNWKGLIKCHKIGIMQADTKIIGILDSDDMLEPFAVDEILKVYNSSQDDNIYVYSNFWYCNNIMEKMELGYSKQVTTNLLNDRCGNHFRTFKLKHYFMTHGYDDDLLYGAEDQDILFQLEEFAKPIYLDKYLYLYRRQNYNTSLTSLKTLSKYSLYISIIKNIIYRYGDIKFVLKITSDINPTEREKYNGSPQFNKGESNVTIDGVKYFFDVYVGPSYNIYFCSLDYYMQPLKINTIINNYLKNINHDTLGVNDTKYFYNTITNSIDNANNKFAIDLKWSNDKLCWIISDQKLNVYNHSRIHPSNYFDMVYVINLKKDVDKRERMEKILTEFEIKYTIFDAIYGKDYLNDYLQKCNLQNYKNPGAYGYTMTMINIFKNAKEKGYKKILVLDDDVIFHRKFLKLFDEYIREIPYDWYLLFLGLSGPWTHPWINKDFYKFQFDKHYVQNLNNCDGSYATGYDSLMFDEFIEVAEKFEYPFDTQIIKHFNNKYPKRCYAFYPYLAIADTTTSDISERATNIRSNFQDYHFKYRINLNDYNLDSLNHRKYQRLKLNYQPKVSIIMTVYNKAPYLKSCIQSIINQTYKNWELIIVEDQSTDDSWKILQQFSKYSKIKILRNNENFGCYVSRNRGIREASGEIIGFQDADDYSLSDRIEKQVKTMLDKDLLMVSCNMIRSHLNNIIPGKDNDIINLVDNKRVHVNIHKNDYEKCCKEYFGYITLLIDRQLFNKFGIYLEHRKGMDMEFPERVLYYLTGKIFNADESSWDFFNSPSYDNILTEENTKFYYKIPELLYISPQMNDLNLTNQNVLNVNFETLKNEWRSCYENNDMSKYPPLVNLIQ